MALRPEEQTTVEVVGTFDLGYVVLCEDGRKGQIRSPHLVEPFVRSHNRGQGSRHVGQTWLVAVILYVETLDEYLFSQHSPEVLLRRKELTTGDTLSVKVRSITAWGYTLEDTEGLRLYGCLPAEGFGEDESCDYPPLKGEGSLEVGQELCVAVFVNGHAGTIYDPSCYFSIPKDQKP